jgi:hypothetical protein
MNQQIWIITNIKVHKLLDVNIKYHHMLHNKI